MIKIDRHTVVQILGALMNKPDLLSDVDKYTLEVNDFPNTLDRFIFSAINNLYNNGDGIKSIKTIDILNYLKRNEIAQSLIEKENGKIFIEDCENNTDVSNFNYYYNHLKKLNFLKDIQKSGRSIEQFYCEDILNPKYSEINEKFETLTVSDILNALKMEINGYETKFVLNGEVKEKKASDGIRDLVKTLKKKPEVGLKFQGDIFNTVTRGARKGKLYIRSAATGVGKALPNSTRIPTPNGWTTVGEIKVGDYLFDHHGCPTKVLGVYPQKQKKQIYKVYFKSGRTAECCDEHLWSYYSNKNDKNPDRLITTTLKELMNNPKGLQDKTGAYRWSIPICEPVQYSEKKYSIDPYVMGLILGDGSFRYSKTQKAFSFSSNDEELVKSIYERMNYESYKKNSEKNYNWTFKKSNENHKNVWVEDILKEYPELWNKKSEDKFIPKDFLMGSVEQRFDLLAGLLDTDGSVDKKGRINFSTVSPYLRDNIIELCESLGMTCSCLIDQREKYSTGEAYNVHIKTTPESKLKIFKLQRKLELVKDYINNNKRKERRDRDSIIKIEATNIFTNMTCFYVDNEEHLFLMDSFICTHNTRRMIGDACQIAYPIRYDRKLNKWIPTGSAEKILYIMTEQDISEIQTMILAYLTGYNEEIFLYGTYGEDELPRIEKAIEIMEMYSDNFMTAEVPDPCSDIIKNLFRTHNIRYGIEHFFYDYIFSSPAMLNEYRDLKVREDVSLRLFTTTLKNLAKELNAFVLTATQLTLSNEDAQKGGFKDERYTRGSKAINDLADLSCIMSRPTQDELQQLSGFQESFSYAPTLVTDVFKNRGGRWNRIRIWSYYDAGSLRTEDLFITTTDMKPIENFNKIDFNTCEFNDFTELCLKMNSSDNGKDDKIMKDYNNVDFQSSEILNAFEAFNDVEDKRKRIEDKSFSDLLTF